MLQTPSRCSAIRALVVIVEYSKTNTWGPQRQPRHLRAHRASVPLCHLKKACAKVPNRVLGDGTDLAQGLPAPDGWHILVRIIQRLDKC